MEVSGVRSSWETLAIKSRRGFSTRSVSVKSRRTATAPPPGMGAAVTSKVRAGTMEVARGVTTLRGTPTPRPPAPRQGGGGHSESARRNKGRGSSRHHLAGHASPAHRTQEIGIPHRLDDGSIQPSALRNQTVHTLVGPLYALVRAEGGDGIRHSVTTRLL